MRLRFAPQWPAILVSLVLPLLLAAAPSVETGGALRQHTQTGSPLSFTVTATGNGDLSYQWLHRGRAIEGATGNTLDIPNASRADAGWYVADVTDADGTTRSQAMFALVFPGPDEVISTELRYWGESRYAPPDGITQPIAISVTSNYNVVLQADGTVVAWNDEIATIPSTIANVVAVSAGSSNGMALLADGTVRVWGTDVFGMLNVPPGLSDVVKIAAGNYHGLALKADGTVVGWGATYSVNNSTIKNGQANIPADLIDVVDIIGGTNFSIAILKDGSVRYWGGSLANDPTVSSLQNVAHIEGPPWDALVQHLDGTLESFGDSAQPVPADLGPIRQFANGGYHVIALANHDDVRTWDWNSNYYGQSTVPDNLDGVLQVEAGLSYSLVLRDASADSPPLLTDIEPRVITELDDVTLSVTVSGPGPFTFQWRHNGTAIPGATAAILHLAEVTLSEAGDYTLSVTNRLGTTVSEPIAVTVNPLPVITSQSPRRQVLEPGATLSLQASATGTGDLSYQWIRNGYPISGATSPSFTLERLTLTDGGWFAIDITDDHGTRRSPAMFVIIAPDETKVTGWGQGYPEAKTITRDANDIVAVEVGRYHSLALTRDGEVLSYGVERSGQYVVPEEARSGIVAISNGGEHALAVRADGSVVAWGDNTSSQIDVPAGLRDIVSVAAGGQHSLALRSDGRVYAWGKPGSAQASAPANLADVVMISAGNSHAAALTRDGRVYSWGGASSYIVNVPENLGDIVSIVAGVDHSFAIDATGTAVGWGADGWHENSVPAAYRGQVLLASAGFQHSFLLLRDGSLQSWGSNVGYMRDYPSGLTGVYDLKGWSGHHLVLESAGPPGLYAPLPGADRNEGQPWKWEAHATGTDPRSYQWFKDGVAIPGQTSSTLNFEELELSDAGSYEVRVTNERGSVTSRPATLTVAPVPVITSQSPLRHVIVPGSDLALAVSATGAGALSYQWSHNGGDIESANSATFELTNANSADSGWYNVEITDDIGTRRSAAMFVQVVPVRTRIIGWGYNAGLASPTWPPAEDDFIEISSAFSERMALRRDGTVQLFSTQWTPEDVKAAIPALTDIVDIEVSGGYNPFWAVLSADGHVRVWGRDSEGQTDVPATLNRVVAIAGGGFHILALKDDGSVVGWGKDDKRQATGGNTLNDAVAIDASHSHSLAIRRDGRGWFWGGSSSTGIYAPDLTDIRSASGSTNNWIAARADGWLASWGRGVLHTLPTGLNSIVSVAAGDEHGLLLTGDGEVIAWGLDADGQATVPAGLGDVFAIRASDYQSAAIIDVTPEIAATIVLAGSPNDSVKPGDPITLTYTLVNDGKRDWTSEQVLRLLDANGNVVTTTSLDGIARGNRRTVTVAFDAPNALGSFAYVAQLWNTATQIPFGTTRSDPAKIVVLSANAAARQRVERVGLIGSTATVVIRNTLSYPASPVSVDWEILLPDGWSFVTSVGDDGAIKPTPGDTDLLSWTWSTGPGQDLSFNTTVKTEAFDGESVTFATLLTVKTATGDAQYVVQPDPLRVRFRHSADIDGDWRISLSELLRVIELYNTRTGTSRTGRYRVDVSATDGFEPDYETTDSGPPSYFHNSDTDHDGRLSLSELLRIIELYNTRSGTTRTGRYRFDSDATDGFDPDTSE